MRQRALLVVSVSGVGSVPRGGVTRRLGRQPPLRQRAHVEESRGIEGERRRRSGGRGRPPAGD